MISEQLQVVMHEVEDLAPSLLQEVLDFISFLKMKVAREQSETALLSESALQKDWLRPEEDAAWRNL
ncbi:MAG: DUF2281 domain-containing protein [Deinococcus sp.]|nr:DUF2281 domain-containing protein [Deinococcus sp.]